MGPTAEECGVRGAGDEGLATHRADCRGKWVCLPLRQFHEVPWYDFFFGRLSCCIVRGISGEGVDGILATLRARAGFSWSGPAGAQIAQISVCSHLTLASCMYNVAVCYVTCQAAGSYDEAHVIDVAAAAFTVPHDASGATQGQRADAGNLAETVWYNALVDDLGYVSATLDGAYAASSGACAL